MQASIPLIEEDLSAYLKGDLQFVEQDPDKVTLAYTISREDEFVSFNRDVQDVYNHIRGLISWPVGYGTLDGTNIKLHKIKMRKESHQHEAGAIVSMSEAGIDVACIGGFITIERLQVAGKPAMDVKDVVHGYAKEWEGKLFQ